MPPQPRRTAGSETNRARRRGDKPPGQCAVSPLEVADTRKSVRARPAPRLRTLDRARLDAQELLHQASSTWAPRRCPCREDMRASERHLTAGSAIARGGGEVVIDANLFERVGLEELPVRVAEMQTRPSKSLEFPARDEDRNRLPTTGQFNLDAGFRLIDNSGKSGSRFSDRVSLRHTSNVHQDVHSCNGGMPLARVHEQRTMMRLKEREDGWMDERGRDSVQLFPGLEAAFDACILFEPRCEEIGGRSCGPALRGCLVTH